MMKHRSAHEMRIYLLALALLARCVGEAQQGKPLGIENALKTLDLAPTVPISLSPDGAWIAYTTQDNSKRITYQDARYSFYTPTGAYVGAIGCDVWLTDTKTHRSRNLTEGIGTSWAPVWSPDGKYLAFYSDRSGEAHLWVWEKDSDRLRQVSQAIVRPFLNYQVARWMPDSRGVVVKTLPSGTTVEQAADSIYGHVKAKDGSRGDDFTAPTVTILKFDPVHSAVKEDSPRSSSPSHSLMDLHRADLSLIDVQTGKVDHLISGFRPSGYWISPDGKLLAYTHIMNAKENTQQLTFQLHVYEFSNRSDRTLVASIENDSGNFVSWSPDSRSLAYAINHDYLVSSSSGPLPRGDCYLFTLNQNEPQLLTPGDHAPLGDYYRAPLWDNSGENLYFLSSKNTPHIIGSEKNVRDGWSKLWKVSLREHKLSAVAGIPDHTILEVVSPAIGGRFWSPDDGRSLVVKTREDVSKREGFYKIDLSSGRFQALYEANLVLGDIFGIDANTVANTVVFVSQDAQHPPDIWVGDNDIRDPHRVSSINSKIGDTVFGTSRLIEYYSADGELLHGALLLPPNYEANKNYPLIVVPYGGALRSNSVFQFGLSGTGVENLQILATRGYAVLLPDTPIHTNSPMQEIAKAVIPAVDRVVELGIADPNRLGIMGHSYGGYSTLSLIVQTTRFKAAIDSAGPSDLVGMYGDMTETGQAVWAGWAETGGGRMGGTPWQYRERYIENSPVFYLDRVETPLLIVHGGLDVAVGSEQMAEVFIGLRRLGKEVTYANYAGESHWEGTWGIANATDYWERVINWFDLHLRPVPTTR